MTQFSIALANPVIVVLCVLVLVAALIKIYTLKFESRIIPPNPTDVKIFALKKNFLYFAIFICGLLPVVNFILVRISGS
jgi:hypothetical protein